MSDKLRIRVGQILDKLQITLGLKDKQEGYSNKSTRKLQGKGKEKGVELYIRVV